MHVLVAERQRESVAEREQRIVLELLRLVRSHLALRRAAHAVTLLGLGQDHGRAAPVVHRRVISGVDLHRIVAAALQPVDVLVRHVRDELLQFRILAEKGLAVEAAVGRRVFLEFAVDGFVQSLEDHVVAIAREQRVPVRTPHDLDDIPAGAGEQPFEFLHDRSVAAHRAVESLQVAVDDEDQVIEPFARRHRQPGDGFGFVHLAVADEAPDLARLGLKNVAVFEIAHEARLVDRRDRAQAHRSGGELPEPGHQPRMAIRRQALAAGFAAIVVEVLFGEPAFHVRAGIDAGRGVRLEINSVAILAGAEEMVVADFEQIRGRSVGRDVAAEFGIRAIGAYHHRQCIPAYQRGNARLDFRIAGKLRLVSERHRICIGRVQHRRHRHAHHARVVQQLSQHEGRPLRAFVLDDGIEGIQPFLGLDRVEILGEHAPEAGNADVGKVGHYLILLAGTVARARSARLRFSARRNATLIRKARGFVSRMKNR